ncbi:hypothetical protein CRYUN_Cryun12cG0020300 [Craigia yunnanensis]
MEKTFTLIQTVATAGVFSAVSYWYGFMFGRESARKELGAAHEALNEIQVEDAEKMLKAEDLANIAKSKFVTQSPNGNSETFNGAATRNQLLRETSIPQRRLRGLGKVRVAHLAQ